MSHPYQGLSFSAVNHPRKTLGMMDVVATLSHFAIVTYAVEASRVRPYVDEKFALDTFTGIDETLMVWVSMVPFCDQDFHFVSLPWLKFRFGQTNYRTYVIDRSTGARAAWFFGTTLDSWSVIIPRNLWKLPWHQGQIEFDCHYNVDEKKYDHYRMKTESTWAPVEIDIEDSGNPVTSLENIPDCEAGLVVLTHPLMGVYFRRDGKLGTYSIWHDKLECHSAKLKNVRIELFDRLKLVSYEEQLKPHSVLLQYQTEFTIHLPPQRYVF